MVPYSHKVQNKYNQCLDKRQGPIVQSIVSLTSLLVVKMLTVLVFKVEYLIHRYFCWKNVSSFSHFFRKNISVYAIFNDQSFNNTLSNDNVSFEQLGPGV